MDNGNGNGVGLSENKKAPTVDAESSSRTASASLVDGSAVENGAECGADDFDDDDVNGREDGEKGKDAVDFDSAAGALREVRLDG